VGEWIIRIRELVEDDAFAVALHLLGEIAGVFHAAGDRREYNFRAVRPPCFGDVRLTDPPASTAPSCSHENGGGHGPAQCPVLPLVDSISVSPGFDAAALFRSRNNVILGKARGQQPGGSVKDRPALLMIKKAEERGRIKPGDTLIESNKRQYRHCAGHGRRHSWLQDGAVDAGGSVSRNVAKAWRPTARKLYSRRSPAAWNTPAISPSKCSATAKASSSTSSRIRIIHSPTTRQPAGTLARHGRPHHAFRFGHGHDRHHHGRVAISEGTEREHRDHRGAAPEEGSRIPGIRKWPEAYLPKIFDRSRVDRTENVSQAASEAMARRLASVEGIFSGISSAARAKWHARGAPG